MARYCVGMDLGTTNTVVYYIDSELENPVPEIFKIPQIVEFGEIEVKESLPSFIYLPDEKEVPEGGLDLPWGENIGFSIGEFAKKNSSTIPNKVISSAKSWLSVDNVDRLAPILPWNRKNSEKQLSPVQATQKILHYIKDAWNSVKAAGAKDRFEDQIIILTVPASFDAVARELTVTAAERVGLKTVLLEEPQAAFYSWLANKEDSWRDKVNVDDTILVCDIGGGTTDFSLIKVIDKDGELGLERIAVGKHILLGGDNMDLAMAYSAAAKIKADKGQNIDAYQISGLTHACRHAKETLMSDPDAKPHPLTVLGRGSSLIGGTLTTEFSKDELNKILLDGFFPACNLDDKPLKPQKSGLRTFGLEYEADPAITKHLASFLIEHCGKKENLPSCILFNGGVCKANTIKERIIEAIDSWSDKKLTVLTGNDPDLAVANGAACYAKVREGQGIRIKAGSSHSYYLGIEASMPAVPGLTPPTQGLCVLPMGTEEGTDMDIDYEGIGLIIGEKTEFRFFSSTLRYDDILGTIIENVETEDNLEEMPSLTTALPIVNELPPGSLIPIKLRCEFTETGTMQIWCFGDDPNHKWKLDFELRG